MDRRPGSRQTGSPGSIAIASAARTALSWLSRVWQPAARAWAKPGYFAPHDWARIAPKRVALIACHWIGDTFWATQVLGPLQVQYPDAKFFAITKPASVDLWHRLLPPDRVIAAPEVTSDARRERAGWRTLARRAEELRALEFDLVIDLTGNRYSAFFVFRLRPVRSIGFAGGELGWLYSQSVPNIERPGRHLSERPFRVIEPLLAGSPRPFAHGMPLRPPTPTCTFEEIAREVGLVAESFFVLAPGAGWPEKEWGAANFIRVGQALAEQGAAILVTGAPAQRSLCEQVAGAIPGALVSWAPIGRTAALLQAAAGVLLNDSGLGHLAAAFGRRTAVVFTGATDPRLYAPLGPPGQVKVFQAEAEPASMVAHLLECSGESKFERRPRSSSPD